MTPSKSGSSKSANRKSRTPPSKNRRTEILLEDMHGTINVIAEGHQMLVENLAGLRAEMKEGFEDQDQKRNLATQALTKRIDGVESSLSKRIDQVAEEVRGLRADVQPRLDDHEARLTVLEGKPAA